VDKVRHNNISKNVERIGWWGKEEESNCLPIDQSETAETKNSSKSHPQEGQTESLRGNISAFT
jgi:hypothetical protein